MTQELRCPRCGAYHTGRVADWVSYVKCAYCNASIPVPKKEMPPQPQQVIVIASPEARPKKTFNLNDFSEFIGKKGYVVDPISGGVKVGSATVYVNEDGSVDGPEPYKTRIEKWISEYMKT